MILVLMLACTGDLLRGEMVLGDERAAIVLTGPAGSGFGAAVAVGTDADDQTRVLVGAPDAGEVMAFDSAGIELWTVVGEPGFGTRVGWQAGKAWAWAPGTAVLSDIGADAVEASGSQATAVAVCPGGDVHERTNVGEAIACTEHGQIAIGCDGAACLVEHASSGLDQSPTSAGSAVGFWGDQACYGDARIGIEEAPGTVTCEDGTQVSGAPGDHLGLAIAGGRVAGVFNRHSQPPRARIVSLLGEETWVVDRAAERSRVALAQDDGLFVIGVPGFAGSDAREGKVFIVEIAQ